MNTIITNKVNAFNALQIASIASHNFHKVHALVAISALWLSEMYVRLVVQTVRNVKVWVVSNATKVSSLIILTNAYLAHPPV